MKNISQFLCAGLFALIFATSTFAQKPVGVGPPSNNNPNLDDRSRQVDESRLRSAEMDSGANAENEKRLLAAIAYMKGISPAFRLCVMTSREISWSINRS